MLCRALMVLLASSAASASHGYLRTSFQFNRIKADGRETAEGTSPPRRVFMGAHHLLRADISRRGADLKRNERKGKDLSM